MEKMDEIDVTLVWHKPMHLLETTNGIKEKVSLRVCECENPYALIFLVEMAAGECRMDITKGDIATTLRNWLEGEQIENACTTSSIEVEEEIMRYVKFGSPPKPMILSQWLLSRCKLTTSPKLKMTIGSAGLTPAVADKDTSKDMAKDGKKDRGSVSRTNFSMSAVSTFSTIPAPQSDKFIPTLEQSSLSAMKATSNAAMKSKEKSFRARETSATSVVLLARDIMGEGPGL